MNNQELLFNLVKKLESGEIEFTSDEDGDCSNKIYQTEDDYKKIKIQCQDKHTRMVCLNCSEKFNK